MQPSIRRPTPYAGRGDIAEVWRGDRKIGVLYQWSAHGSAVDWEGDALKYRLSESGGGEVEIRLLHTSPSGTTLQLSAFGHIASAVEADGELHKQAVRIKGTRLEIA